MLANPTLYDVAREAGVSLATASRALNGSSRVVKEEYRERVLAAAQRLGYTPNLSAQAVARGTSSTVALLVSDIADPYFSSIAAGVNRAAAAEGLAVTMAVTNRDPAQELALVRILRGQRPRAIILAGSRFTAEDDRETLLAELGAYLETGGSVSLISQHDLPFDTVAIDNAAGAGQLATALVGLGYRGFGILAGPENLVTARDRATAFAGSLPAPPLAVVHGAFSREAGYAGMLQLLDSGMEGLDAVFAVNDVMAIGALAALRDRSLTTASVAVAGFDDIPMAADANPPLTTVRVDLEAAGASAVELALDDGHSPATVRVPVEVVVRASTPGR
ncbi:LacI family DNA-binding transcriptional regulator [soil metagenome]